MYVIIGTLIACSYLIKMFAFKNQEKQNLFKESKQTIFIIEELPMFVAYIERMQKKTTIHTFNFADFRVV